MRKYALNLNSDNRILSATFEEYDSAGVPLVDELPSNELTDDITEFLYVNGEYVYSPKPVPPPVLDTWGLLRKAYEKGVNNV